ncbi:hypothetical protein [Psychroserpens ponticola]|uniref:Uncharacterized protein n=1 Tax=Psychroserpens ponticola TaxID=2932268 RepID=A0ABY7RXV9_9FLAO|nr:hypothetical protein [Psychroserpens ponticola]WCO01521.1 hypothetical protein MUN68_015825 [Psychroserpens ponticola]
MTTPHKSIFNLIEIFRSSPKHFMNTLVAKTHCENQHIHDYYCDAETPHINSK